MPESKRRYASEMLNYETRAKKRKQIIDLFWRADRINVEERKMDPRYADPKERERSLPDIIKDHQAELAPYTKEDKIILEEFGLAFEKGKNGQIVGRLKTTQEYLPQTAGEDYAGGDVPGQWIPEDASKFFLLSALRAQKGEIKKFDVIVKEIQYMVLEKLDLTDMSEAEAEEAIGALSQTVEDVLAEESKEDKSGAVKANSERIEGRFRAILKRAGDAGKKVYDYLDAVGGWNAVVTSTLVGATLVLLSTEVYKGIERLGEKSVDERRDQRRFPDEPKIQYEGLEEPKLYELAKGGAESLWDIAKKEIVPQFYPTADDMSIQLVAKALAEDNDIAVPERGVSGNSSHRQLQEGERIVVGPHTKAVLTSFGPDAHTLVEQLYP